MLKFFRKYNKYILVVGGSLLMVVFLLQGTMSMFMPSGASTPIGTINSGKITITAGDRRTASIELDVLNNLGLGQLPPLAQSGSSNDDLRYYLMVTAAKQIGLSASQIDVQQVLQIVGADKQQVTKLATRYRSKPAFIHQAVRHWLMIEAYRNLALGHGFQRASEETSTAPGIQLLQLYAASMQAYQNKNYNAAQALRAIMIGTGRVSQPVVAHFLEDVQSHATGKLISIDSKRYMDKVSMPEKKQLQKLFKEYKHKLPGESKPYGFGYRIPNRVKLVYILIPFKKTKQSVHINEAQTLSYYQNHQDEFTLDKDKNSSKSDSTTQPDTENGAKIKPYSKVRAEIIKKLTNKKSQKLATQMAKTAQSQLLEDIRPLPRKNGYRELPDNFKPVPFTEVSNQLEKQFKVKPVVENISDHWIDKQSLDDIPVLGISYIGSGRGRHSFSDYVLSAKELNPSNSNALIARRLQVGVPSAILKSSKGPIIFRLIAAQPAHEPKNLKSVKDKVVLDAKKIEAYKLLLTKKQEILNEAAKKGIDSVASTWSVSTKPFKSISRRTRRFGTLQVPYLPGIGQNKKVVDSIFQTANSAIQHNLNTAEVKNKENSSSAKPSSKKVDKFSDINLSKRIGAIGMSKKLSLALFQVDGYKQLTHKQFKAAAKNIPLLAIAANSAMNTNIRKNPLSLDALKKRLDFKETKMPENNKTPGHSNPRPAPIGM